MSTNQGKAEAKALLERARNIIDPFVRVPYGRIYVIYDYQRHADKQILMAVMTEEDVAAGACDSDTARLRALINQATGENPERK